MYDYDTKAPDEMKALGDAGDGPPPVPAPGTGPGHWLESLAVNVPCFLAVACFGWLRWQFGLPLMPTADDFGSCLFAGGLLVLAYSAARDAASFAEKEREAALDARQAYEAGVAAGQRGSRAPQDILPFRKDSKAGKGSSFRKGG